MTTDICVNNILPARTRSGMARMTLDNPVYYAVGLSELASQLYSRQISHINKGTGDKTELVKEFEVVLNSIQYALQHYSMMSKTVRDVQEWVELICWKTRISLFNKSVLAQ
jgi:hypothetical protein